jgi:SAM-dependent methyltransferase
VAETYEYLMENPAEIFRLEIKTDPNTIRKQALWCGLKSGMRVLDAACGPGKTTAILHEIIQPDGEIIGLDASERRVQYALKHYGSRKGIDFHVKDLRKPLEGLGDFDLIWVRFILEYFRVENPDIVRNLTSCLKPEGTLCLIDLDYNCLSHFELPKQIEDILVRLVALLEEKHNFDPYVGRKLYSYLFDLGYQDIQMDMTPHHLIYGKIREQDIFNWVKKVEVVSSKEKWLFENYSGGHTAFLKDFMTFLTDPRRFTYTPLIICKGIKPA